MRYFLGPQDPPQDEQIYNRRMPDGSYRPLSGFFTATEEDTTMVAETLPFTDFDQPEPLTVEYPPLMLVRPEDAPKRRLPTYEARCVHIGWMPTDDVDLVSIDTNFEEFVNDRIYLDMLEVAIIRLKAYIRGYREAMQEDEAS